MAFADVAVVEKDTPHEQASIVTIAMTTATAVAKSVGRSVSSFDAILGFYTFVLMAVFC